MKLEVEVTVTKQVRQYEPLTVRIKAEKEAPEGKETATYKELRNDVTAMVQDTLVKNLSIYQQ